MDHVLSAYMERKDLPGLVALVNLPPGGILSISGSMSTTTSTNRITIEPEKRGGKPCVRGLRITVWEVLALLGAGMSEEQILHEHPDLEKADFPAVYQFAAETGRKANFD
jgi:uncharacterized protein (DUF433 family)